MLSTADPSELSFATKVIHFFGNERTVLLQNENGPCPLLAIANCLILTNRISFPDQRFVGLSSLVYKIAEVALTGTGLKSEVHDDMYDVQLDSVLETIPKLKGGLDLNVKFTAVNAMEFTSELCVFDALGIDVLHGWLLDPQDLVTRDTIESMSINQLFNELVKCDIAHAAERMFDIKRIADEILEDVIDKIRFGDSERAAEDTAKTAPSEQYLNERKTNSDILRRGEIIKAFIDQSKTHMSHHGLCQLHADMKERQMAVLYRNAHFTTIFKFEGMLYTLVSDEGYRLEKSVVWERLENINGDTEYVDDLFCQLKTSNESTSPPFEQHLTNRNMQSPTICPSAIAVDEMDSDHKLALMLQQEELDERRRAEENIALSSNLARVAPTLEAHQQYPQYQQFDLSREPTATVSRLSRSSNSKCNVS